MARVLVTGAAGYIGTALVRRLLDEGHYVVGVDKVAKGLIEGKHAKAMLRDLVAPVEGGGYEPNVEVIDELRKEQPRVVVNLAGASSPARYAECPLRSEIETYVLPDELRSAFPEVLFVQAGTVMPVEASVEPEGGYATDKADAERDLRDFVGPGPTVVARFATVVGASPKMRWDLAAHAMARDAVAGRPVKYVPGLVRPFVSIERVVGSIAKWIALDAEGRLLGRCEFRAVELCDAVLSFGDVAMLARSLAGQEVGLEAMYVKAQSFSALPTGWYGDVTGALGDVVRLAEAAAAVDVGEEAGR